MRKPQVVVTVSGGIAYTEVTRGEVDVILIDWDEYEDNLGSVETVLQHIEWCKGIDESQRDSYFETLHYHLTSSAGESLEDYDDPQDAEEIRMALAEAGYPLPETEGQLVMPLVDSTHTSNTEAR